jgi:GT2 family glycosyltransferase
VKKVSIVTVNFNQSLVTEQLLASIAETNNYPNIEIIVVDNASKDNPIPGWIEKYKDIKFLRSDLNLGFAGGNNLGMKIATGDYYFLVNNDTEFTEGLVEKMVALMDEHPKIGMSSPKICYFQEPEMLQYVGFTPMNFNTARNKCIGQFEKDQGQYDDTTGPTGYIHGAAMMVRREAIELAGMMVENFLSGEDNAGLMNENFFLYYEEIDWCEQIKRCGYEAWVEPKALIYHKESLSVGKKSPLKEFFMNRNRILFIRRNSPSRKSRVTFYLFFLLVVTPRNILGYLKDRRMDLAVQLFRAIGWNLTHRKFSADLGYPISRIP